MNTENIRLIVTETLNIVEHEYGCEDVSDLGSPTIEEIVARIETEHAALIAS
jgi:hypothetical protein